MDALALPLLAGGVLVLIVAYVIWMEHQDAAELRSAKEKLSHSKASGYPNQDREPH